MNREPAGVVVRTVCRRLTPFVQLFGLYVIMHGHSSPGGGFQGGVILAASAILLVLAEGTDWIRRVSLPALTVLTSTGVLLYAGVGGLCLALGANFLDYSVLPFAEPRSVGMLLIEIGVGITVMAALVSIFRDLVMFE